MSERSAHAQARAEAVSELEDAIAFLIPKEDVNTHRLHAALLAFFDAAAEEGARRAWEGASREPPGYRR
jgi:hypothetical protein